VTLDELVALHDAAEDSRAGVAAVLEAVADEAQRLAARSVDVYDNRLVYQLAAELNRTAKPHG